MSRRRTAGGFGPVQILVVVAFLEVAINRVAVPLLRPEHGAPPAWHTALDYLGLFLFYFTATLALALVAAQIVARARRGALALVPAVLLGVAGLVAAVPLVVAAPAWLSLPLEAAFALAVIALAVDGLAGERDLGVRIGVGALALPLLVHTLGVVGDRFLWPEGAFDMPGHVVVRIGIIALCLAALASPYLFAPRPFARAVTRPVPVLVAMVIAAAAAVAARMWYATVAKIAALAIGIELYQTVTDPWLALYLLSIATLAWTLVSCAMAASEARRTIGMGIALIVLGGYGFRWPSHYLLPLVGLALVVEAGRHVRDEELAAMPITTDAPPIEDAIWSGYVAAVTGALKRTLADVHSLTVRGDNGLASSLIVGDRAGITVRTRIERIFSSVIAIDVVIGREVDERRGATVALWAIPPRQLGTNPAGPPAAPTFRTGDGAFDERFRCRGSSLALGKLLDDGLRARVVATLDGWLAYWEPDGLRYRVYPGRGAPLDHPIPLSDLALGRSTTPERLVAVIELLCAIAERGVAAVPIEPARVEEPV
ncbi:MAG TPA: hypothetical protein VLX92_25875 [Kofleriaceae bacterium]|nr:hypothetical protein [Kofleriaceae bacterium]